MKICWVLPDLWHYHHARYDFYSRSFNCDSYIVEVFGRSAFPELRSNANNAIYRVHTLFPNDSPHNVPFDRMKNSLFQALDRINPGVVCVPGWSDRIALLTLYWCIKKKVPSLVLSDSQKNDFPRNWWKEYIKKIIIRMFSASLVGGKPHFDYITTLGLPENRCFIGCSVIDNDYFIKGSEEARRNAIAVKSLYSLPKNYFLYSGRLVEKKNVHRLLQAYSGYRKAEGNGAWKLVILGDGPLMPKIKEICQIEGISEDVILPGFKGYSELPAYYGLAGAFILASVTEQWGLVVNEAMASGLPVIVSNRCGCAMDLVYEGVNGYLFDPYDINALTQIMKGIAASDFDREKMGSASRGIIAHWSIKIFAENLNKAAVAALSSPLPKAGWTQELLLRVLALR